MAAAAYAEIPPVVHALGGSLGSALALLLFYPLERARIELQSQASSVGNNRVGDEDIRNSDDDDEEKNELEFNVTTAMESSTVEHPNTVIVMKDDNVDNQDANARMQSPSAASSSDDSWEPLAEQQKSQDGEEMVPSWSMGSSEDGVPSSSLSVDSSYHRKKFGLLQCLLRLHKRRALYQGVTPVMTTIFSSQFIFFYMNAYVKSLLKSSMMNQRHNSHQHADHPIVSLLSSCIAGIANVLLTNPLWVVNMAIITGDTKSNSLWNEFWTIVDQKGWKHMWSGTWASILLVSNPVIQFFCYEQFKESRIKSKMNHHQELKDSGVITSKKDVIQRHSLDAVEAFALGAMAKGIATLMTYPLQLAQTVLRLKDNGYRGTMDCLLKLLKRGGFKEWYTGIRAKLLQTVLTSAFMFLTYEQILGAVQVALIKATNQNNKNFQKEPYI